MKKVQLGKTDVYVTPLAFGAWAIGGWMWGGADKEDALDAIAASLDMGISSIDTAPAYGHGLSEELIGEVIKGRRDKVEILTKYGLRWDTLEGEFFFDTVHNDGHPVKMHRYASKEGVIWECEQSLKRLKTDYIDLYQIHWSDPTTPVEETMEAMDILQQQGKIRAAGVCNYDVELSKRAAACITLASNQVSYSMVNRAIEKEVAPWCIDEDVSILAYSPLQRGLLTGKITTDYIFEEGDTRPTTPYFSKENIYRVNSFLDRIRPMAEDKQATLGQLVTAWTLAQPGITVALVGARNRKQVTENARAMELSLSSEEVKTINEFLDQLELKF
ncbi:aldo/keto reductase [Bacteroidota bacterium]